MLTTVGRLSEIEPVDGLRVAHLQHPGYGKPPPFVAWCGAEVIGMMASSAAPVCSDCRAAQRRARENVPAE